MVWPRLEVVGVDARELNLIARPRLVDQVVQHDDLLAARQPPRGHVAGGLLQREALVVAVHRAVVPQEEIISKVCNCFIMFQLRSAESKRRQPAVNMVSTCDAIPCAPCLWPRAL